MFYGNDDRLYPKTYSKDAESPQKKKITFVEDYSITEMWDCKAETN